MRKYNLQIILILILILIILFYFLFIYQNQKNMLVEGYRFLNSNKWSDDLKKRFIEYQNTVNNNSHRYNLKVLESQAKPEEVEHLLKTGYWPWSDEIKYLYMDAVFHNKIIKIQPDDALDYAMKIYNENAVKKLLSWNTKEGEFLLYGAYNKDKGKEDLSLTNFDLDASYSLIRCGNTETNKPVMKKYTYFASNGYLLPSESIIENKNIPDELRGFKFYNNVCNPCNVFKDDDNYNCPFIINTKEDKENNISTIWRKLWNI
jgi:hypothetical protein